ncbi:oligosaccharide flippase family protein [Methanogenium organophilum]|uniref:Oligosaccharide flippase family protein n=1 Tax=Methanogenium organophilum TaxID=2199 RepID=A0A9X9S3P7_METOG|nr:oligosaccharide flippase family protein [Methanogenium organophilum]WAI01172.1 oligosaccharide flippase family protein [Methanogenium organophilum]
MTLFDSQSFAKDVLKLVTGTTFAQIIIVLSSPVLTRLYGPEAFGLLAIFTSIMGIIGIIACVRYELAIMLPDDDREAANLLGICLLCAVMVSILTIPIFYFGGDFLISLLQAPDLAPYLIIIPLFVFVNGVFLSLNYWNSRTKLFGRLSIANIISSVTGTGVKLGAGLAGYTTGGSLIGANLIGSSVSTAVLGGQIWRDDRVLLRESISWKKMLEGLKRYKKFPLIDSGSALLNTLSWHLPTFILAAFFSPVIVGYYSLGFMVLQLPMTLIGGSISQVFFQQASVEYRSGDLASFVETISEVLLKVGLLPMLIVGIVGPDIFSVVFGSAWEEAGLYAQILSFWTIIWFLYAPLSTIYVVLEKQSFGLIFSGFNFITRIISLFVGGMMGSVVIALGLLSFSGILIYGIFFVMLVGMAGMPRKNIIRVIGKSFGITIPAIVILIFAKLLALNSIIILVLSCLIFIAYYLYVVLADPNIKKFIPFSFNLK